MDNCFPYLMGEIKILKPKVIVAIGRRVYNELKRRGLDREYKLERITHYSYAFGRGKGRDREKRLREELKRITTLVNLEI